MTLEQAKELGQLDLWKAVQQEIDNWISFETKKFMTCKPEEIHSVREKIMAYQQVQKLDKIVIDREEE
jgi:hypothetical protein